VANNLKDGCLSNFQQVVLVLVKLRLNIPFELLGDLFCVSQSTAICTFHFVLHVMYEKMHFLVNWPDRFSIKAAMPLSFIQSFGRKVMVIIDCFEVRLERASSLQARNQTVTLQTLQYPQISDWHYTTGNDFIHF
jgi:hypothetical protein